ncbi:hypothetical protein NDU88_006128, partial [Pleurodeles waltl]
AHFAYHIRILLSNGRWFCLILRTRFCSRLFDPDEVCIQYNVMHTAGAGTPVSIPMRIDCRQSLEYHDFRKGRVLTVDCLRVLCKGNVFKEGIFKMLDHLVAEGWGIILGL